MSATIYYQAGKGKALDVGAPSSFMGALRRAFGHDGPWTLTDHDYYVLHGLAAGLSSEDQQRACDELAEAAMRYGEIRVWPEY